MNSISLRERAFEPTPKCSSNWVALSIKERRDLVQSVIERDPFFLEAIVLYDVADDGFVTIGFKRVVTPNDRGNLLLDFERTLKLSVDRALTVWLKPLGDRSSLRNLRGIEVKND